MNEKVEYILQQLEGKPKEDVTLEFDMDTLQTIADASASMGVTINEFIELSLIESLIDLETEKYEDKYDNIIDIYDFYRLEDFMDTGKTYLVINPTGEPVIMMPASDYQELFR